MDKTNVTLIGMPGCGKSTVGVLLAKALNLHFTDTDLLIQQKHGRFLREILEADGIDGFIQKESEVLRALRCEHTCIATGGSAVYSDAAMRHLKEISTVVFIDLPCAAVEARVADIRGRGVVIDSGKTLAELYRERRPLYLRYADITVAAGGLAIEELLMEIATRVIKVKLAG